MDAATLFPKLQANIEQAAGKIDKAIIVFDPLNLQKPEVDPAVDQASGSSWGSMLADAAKSAGKSALQSAMGIVGLDSTLFFDGETAPPNTFIVDFNPKSISFDASYDLHQQKDRNHRDDKEGKLPQASASVAKKDENTLNATMTVDLIFNDVDIEDAFLENKLNPVNGEAVQSVAKSAVKVMGINDKTEHSVRDKVQALVCAARNPKLRKCSFNWGKTSFVGEINNLTINYTMFSPKGEPIHAVVKLTMELLYGPSNTGQWDDMYKEAFGDGTGYIKALDKGTLGGLASSVSSLGNIPL